MATAAEHQAQIDRINTEVAAQAAKIAQLSTILDGKAAGGGASVETCTVTLSLQNNYSFETLCAITFKDGVFSEYAYSYPYEGSIGGMSYPLTLENVVCGSCMVLIPPFSLFGLTFTGGATEMGRGSGIVFVKMPAEPNAICTIYCYDDD